MPKWLEKFTPIAGAAVLWVTGYVWVKVVERMTGSDTPTWTLVLAAIILTVVSLFFQRVSVWLWESYQSKRFKVFIMVAVLSGFIIWLGWPRIQSISVLIKEKPQVISGEWTSEQEAEQFIIEQLRNKGKRTILVSRVRRLLAGEYRSNTIGQFKCEGDSVWHRLMFGHLQVAGFTDAEIRGYDGTVLLSEYLGCEVMYSTEVIRRYPWVAIDSVRAIVSPNPGS